VPILLNRLKKYMEFFNNDDASSVAELHSDEALIVPPNIDMVNGKILIKKVISD
tara:strand:+ start:392 stop:553 length:162 start_codon:yes stop_codon:yes gene_type:complete